MSSVVLCARLLLAGVFTVAATAKLLDLNSSRQTVEAFGLPRRMARPLGTMLPFAELAVAAALLPQSSARYGAICAVVLLLVFSAGVAFALSQGRTPDCNCFGQVSSSQIGPRTLVRNGVLVVLAGFAAWQAPGSSLSSWTQDAHAANLVAGLAVLTAALLAVSTVHFRSRVHQMSADGPTAGAADDLLQIGTPAPDFDLLSLDGASVSRDQLLERGRPLVLVFASPTCGPCRALMPELARWYAALNERLTIVVIEAMVQDPAALAQQMHALGDFPVLVEEGRDVASAYKSRVTPTAIGISPEGRVVELLVPGQNQIEALVRRMLRLAPQVPAPVGGRV